MMKKFSIFRPVIGALLLLIFLLSSCEQWLTVPPENDLIKEKFWKKTEDVYSSLSAMYNAFRDASMPSLIWGEVRADMVTMGTTNFADYERIASSNISPSNEVINWSNYYRAINLANTLMYYDKEVFESDQTFTREMMNGVNAEALFIRSLSFFYLVRVWKDVPLVITPSLSDTSNLFIPKSSEKVVLKQIIKDLLKAKDLAYTTELISSPTNFKGRANKYAIMALLSDVYLWNEQYQKSSDYCDSIMASGIYGLEPTETWFNIYYPGNSPSESIFEIQFDDALDEQQNPIYDNLIPLSGGPQMTVKLQSLQTIMSPLDIRNINPLSPTNPRPLWKYLGLSPTSTISRSFNQRDANFIVYRFADILLIKAEALTEMERFSEANDYLRQTKERAGLLHVNIESRRLLRQAILDERGREFIVEGKRWFDILRAAKRNKFENKQLIIDMILSGADIKLQAILRAKVYDTLSYYLPIPEHELRYNQNLVQNPYYDR